MLRIIQYFFLIFWGLAMAGMLHDLWTGAQPLKELFGPFLLSFALLGISSWARDKANAKVARDKYVDSLIARDRSTPSS